MTECGRAVWACVYQATPMVRGSGQSRGRQGETDRKARYLWRNMMFRNEGAGLSSELIKTALERTYEEWAKRYGSLPAERLRTEVDIKKVKSPHPGFCYLMAGFEKDRIVRGKLYLWAPLRAVSSTAEQTASNRPIGVQLPGCAPSSSAEFSGNP